MSSKTDPRSVVTSAAYLLFYRRRSDRPLGGPRLQELLESSNHAGADSDAAAGSRDSSPVAGEGRRLGDSSHNGLSSAYTAGPGHRVGADGSAAEEESQDRGLLAGGESPPRLLGPLADDDLPPYQDVPPYDEGVVMEDNVPVWQQTWGFDGLPTGPRVPAPSEDGGMFGEKGSSNDSTRVEGNAGSPAHSLLGLDDADVMDEPMYSESNTIEEYGRRNMRESAPPPEVPDMVNDEEDDPPVMELQADPRNNDELVFNPAA